MKIQVAILLCLVTLCATVLESQAAETDNPWQTLQTWFGDIYDKIRGKKTKSNIENVGQKLSDRIGDAIDNLSKTKVKDFLPTLKKETEKTGKSFGVTLSDFFDGVSKVVSEKTLPEFFDDVAKAIDANGQKPNSRGGGNTYFF